MFYTHFYNNNEGKLMHIMKLCKKWAKKKKKKQNVYGWSLMLFNDPPLTAEILWCSDVFWDTRECGSRKNYDKLCGFNYFYMLFDGMFTRHNHNSSMFLLSCYAFMNNFFLMHFWVIFIIAICAFFVILQFY